MKKVDNEFKKYLFEIFPNILDEELNEEDKIYYDSFAISIFDHWLTEEEANEFLFKYLWKNYNNNCFEEYKDSEKKYLLFFTELSNIDNIYSLEENSDHEQSIDPEYDFWKIENSKELKNICLSNIRGEKLFKLCMPKLRAIISGSYDMTQIVYFRKDHKKDLFYDLIEKSQLYVLM